MRTPTEIESAFAPRSALAGRSAFHLVGVGGAGMAGLARMLLHRGFTVSGTDTSGSAETDRLVELGAQVTIGHTAEGVTADSAVVLSDAIDLNDSPEATAARKVGAPLFRRSQVLGWLLEPYKVIAVTGTHGKTTTTGLIGVALASAGLDPLVVVGANVEEFAGPVREGQGDWAVVEACEAYDALRDLDPTHVVLTNFEADHLDFHGSWEGLREAMRRFLARAQGRVIACAEDVGAREVAAEFEPIWYGAADRVDDLRLPGDHNALNAAAAVRVAELLQAGDVRPALRAYRGAERRLQSYGQVQSRDIYDDYAHHPREIDATIQALRARHPGQRLVVVFQPHLYSRTADLIPEFAAALSAADLVVITDIYPAREAPLAGVSSARIAEKITCDCRYVPSRHLLPREVIGLAKDGDVVVGMGAGNISEFVPAFLHELRRGEKRRVIVCFGGDSAEREVSLHSGRAIHAALVRRGFQAQLLDLSEALLGGKPLEFLAGPDRPDAAFLAVHGTHAEDGAIQGFFELIHIPYTGSGIQASALAMDKDRAKQVLGAAGLPVPRGFLLRRGDPLPSLEAIRDQVGGACIVKPNAQGSTVGLSFVEDLAQAHDAIQKALQYDESVLIEEWVRGMEISVPVLVDEALPAVEIVPASGLYDFEMKYTPGATEEICPARVSPEVADRVRQLALDAHKALRCSGATRTDMIVRDGTDPVILEVNTLPGMTPTSLLPKSAGTAGISFDDLCVRILNDAFRKTPV